MSSAAWSSRTVGLAPFNWEASPVDRVRDSFAHCGAQVRVSRVGDVGFVYQVSIANESPESQDRQPGHALNPLLVECSGQVSEGSFGRLQYIQADSEADSEKIRHAARGLIAGVAQHHADGYCVWGWTTNAERFYSEWLSRPADWMDTHIAECGHCNGLGWWVYRYERPARGEHPEAGLTKEECLYCRGRGLVYFERKEVGSDTYHERPIPEEDPVPPFIPRTGVPALPEGFDLQHLADAYNADCRADEGSR